MSRMTDYKSRPSSRPDSANLIDLHVYKVPTDIWRDRFNNLLNQSVCETVSLGIIRVPPDLLLCDVRNELNRQLDDLIPADFVFLRSVGRSLTKLKAKQEYEMKAKYFLPPTAYAPELYLLEAGADLGSSLASDTSSRAHSRNQSTERDGRPGYNSYRGGPYDNRYTQTKGGNENTPQGGTQNLNTYRDNHRYTPLPRIESRSTSRIDSPSHHPKDPNKSYTHSDNTSHTYRETYQQQQLDRPQQTVGQTDAYHKAPSRKGQYGQGYDRDYYINDPNSLEKPVESHTKGRHNDAYSSPNTNHTNEDSGIAGLSPEDRERDRYLEDHERRKRELQERLDREKAKHLQRAMDDEKKLREEEERERQHMDEREREMSERRRKAEAARRQREEEDRRRQEEEQRKWEEEQDRLDKQRRNETDQERERRRKEREARRKRELEEEEERRKREREQEEAEEEEARKKREAERAKEKRGRNNLTYRRKSGEDGDIHRRNQGRRGANDDDRNNVDDGDRRNHESGRRSGDGNQDDDKNNRNRGRYGRSDDDRLRNGDDGRNNDHDRLRNGDQHRTGWSDDDDDDKRRNRRRSGDDDERRRRSRSRDASKDGRLQGKDDDNDRYRGRDDDTGGAGNRRKGSKGGSEDGFATPPALEMKSPREVRDTDSAYARRRDEKEKLLAELDEARDGRRTAEQDREELVKRAKQLQHKTTNRRNNARDMWKKRYFEEKKRTAPLEDQTNRLRHELEAIHRKLMSTLEGPKDGKQIKYIDGKPSPKNNYIIQCTRLQHEIEDLRRRAENAKMKLTAEMKLRNQADAELRALRAELTQKKINLTLSRNQQLAALNPGVDGTDTPAEVTVEN